jgi:hypothetical protein
MTAQLIERRRDRGTDVVVVHDQPDSYTLQRELRRVTVPAGLEHLPVDTLQALLLTGGEGFEGSADDVVLP